MKNIAFCPHCNNKLEQETDKDLKKEYKFICKDCDENFYSFEVVYITQKER